MTMRHAAAITTIMIIQAMTTQATTTRRMTIRDTITSPARGMTMTIPTMIIQVTTIPATIMLANRTLPHLPPQARAPR
jgi:hypothetical protein